MKISKVINLRITKNLVLIALFGMGFSLSTLVNAAISCTAAQPVTLNATTGLKRHLAGGNEVYKITAPSSGLLSVFSTNNNGIYLSLYNQYCLPLEGTAKYYNNMSGKSLEQGTYYVVVSDYRGASDYQLRIDGDFSTDDRGNSCTNNPWIARSKNESGIIGPYGDQDFFQFTLANSQTFKASALSGSGVYLKIYNRSCIPLPGNYYNNISLNLNAGLYYISVQKYPNTSGTDSYPYELKFDPSVSLKFPTGTCAGKAATLSGTNGDDVIKGTAGNDVIQTGLGNDVIYGLTGNDILCGGEGDDVLIGADGIDSLNGEGGNDILQGGNANDTLNGGLGNDTCDGGALTDTATACEVKNLVP